MTRKCTRFRKRLQHTTIWRSWLDPARVKWSHIIRLRIYPLNSLWACRPVTLWAWLMWPVERGLVWNWINGDCGWCNLLHFLCIRWVDKKLEIWSLLPWLHSLRKEADVPGTLQVELAKIASPSPMCSVLLNTYLACNGIQCNFSLNLQCNSDVLHVVYKVVAEMQ